MKVLILGGTGAMGRHLVRRLAGSGMDIAVTSRVPRASEAGVRYIRGDAQNRVFLQQALSEHWDAIVDFMIYTTAQFEERAELLLSATSQYVFISSGRVYAESGGPLAEDSERLLDICKDQGFLATDEYALAKARQEDVLRHSGRRNWTIIRPYVTYGEERLQLGPFEKEGWLYRALRGRPIAFSRDISDKITTLTYGLDVSGGIAALIGKPGTLGEAFNIATGESLTWTEVLDVYLDVLQKHLGYRPEVALLDLESFEQCHFAKHQIRYDRLYDRRFDCRKIEPYVDVANFTGARAGLRECLERFLREPRFLYINWDFEGLKDRKTKVRTPLSEIPGRRQKARYLWFRYIRS